MPDDNKENEFGELLSDKLEKLRETIKSCLHPQYSVEGYMEFLSPIADEMILSGEKDNLTYAGGKCTMAYDEANHPNEPVAVTIEVFFRKDNDAQVVKKSVHRQIDKSYFTEEALAVLQTKGEQVFDILPPAQSDTDKPV